MLLRVASSFSLSTAQGENLSPLFSSSVSSPSCLNQSPSALRFSQRNGGDGFVVLATNRPLTSVEFEPFEEVKKELLLVPTVPQESLVRQKYLDECEVAVNEQIK